MTTALRPLTGYFFEDYSVGQHFVHATPRTITAGDVALYIALTGARQAPHCAATVAQALGYPDTPVDDMLVFHIAFGKTVPDVSYNAVANLGYADVRFTSPVYAGDTIRCESTVIGLKENSNRKTGVVYVRSTAYNQREEQVLTWARWVMINKRHQESPAQDTVVPMLPRHVAEHDLVIPAGLTPRALGPAFTASARNWTNYEVGEIIDHPAGMTIDESDHTLATKLYQNTARVHFDQHHMKDSRFGRRLVYGGHIISICRALSFDGLENVISIAAINGGSHLNPTFAGDTIYAKSVVLDKQPLSDELGALRLRLMGIKNDPPGQVVVQSHDLPPSVVLDLDYTVLMPRH